MEAKEFAKIILCLYAEKNLKEITIQELATAAKIPVNDIMAIFEKSSDLVEYIFKIQCDMLSNMFTSLDRTKPSLVVYHEFVGMLLKTLRSDQELWCNFQLFNIINAKNRNVKKGVKEFENLIYYKIKEIFEKQSRGDEAATKFLFKFSVAINALILNKSPEIFNSINNNLMDLFDPITVY